MTPLRLKQMVIFVKKIVKKKSNWKMKYEYSLSEKNKSSTNQPYLQNYDQ